MKMKIISLLGLLYFINIGMINVYADTLNSIESNIKDKKDALYDATTKYLYEKDINTNEVTIVGYTGDVVDVVLPSMINGLYVTKIGENAFNGATGLKSITGKNIKSLGSGAFKDCSNLVDVDFPNLYRLDGINTFVGCSNLTEINLKGAINIAKGKQFEDTTTVYIDRFKDVNLDGDSSSWDGIVKYWSRLEVKNGETNALEGIITSSDIGNNDDKFELITIDDENLSKIEWFKPRNTIIEDKVNNAYTLYKEVKGYKDSAGIGIDFPYTMTDNNSSIYMELQLNKVETNGNVILPNNSEGITKVDGTIGLTSGGIIKNINGGIIEISKGSVLSIDEKGDITIHLGDGGDITLRSVSTLESGTSEKYLIQENTTIKTSGKVTLDNKGIMYLTDGSEIIKGTGEKIETKGLTKLILGKSTIEETTETTTEATTETMTNTHIFTGSGGNMLGGVVLTSLDKESTLNDLSNLKKIKRGVTRSDIAKEVVNLLGIKVDSEYNNTFSDVIETMENYEYIMAVNKLGLMVGYGRAEFKPNNVITRQEMAVVISNILEYVKKDVSDTTYIIETFEDFGDIKEYAVSSIAKVYNIGILDGTVSSLIAPLDELKVDDLDFMLGKLSEIINM